ncbi:FtsX-like permease family protein [Pedobacter sp. JY14-1]|uniref:ABC transporter permease n=1 Tax=Pedobacter sp. JY14-1 TaxID=3034151 RepID=UPI0023E1DC3C|nr:FtsX-like permease family protein [Pedobacter sp. JY14-1]
MNVVTISWKNIRSKPLGSALNIMLVAFGTGILTLLLLASGQISDKLARNSKDIDLVVGAKGSPLQLILSSIYYIDFPTGNIPLKDAAQLMRNPMVRKAVPLALGDNYNGTRIVGTDTGFVGLYGLKLHSGRFWHSDFETVIGAAVARSQQLKVGDTFYGAHGLTGSSDVHQSNAYKVTGILEAQGSVADDLILTTIPSVWKMHNEESAHDHQEDEAHDHDAHSEEDKELTALLIQYRSPMSVAIFPRMVNETTNMQAASPAQESTRLFSLIGVGVDTLQWFAVLIMVIAGISVFVSLYNALKERAYDLAVMRTLGASRTAVFAIVIFEGLVLTFIGSLAGVILAHIGIELIGSYQESSQARLSGLLFMGSELYIIAAGLFTGVVSSVIPAIRAYRTDISGVLSGR